MDTATIQSASLYEKKGKSLIMLVFSVMIVALPLPKEGWSISLLAQDGKENLSQRIAENFRVPVEERTVNLDFREAPLRDVLREFSIQAGIRFSVKSEVAEEKRVTYSGDNKKALDALAEILYGTGLTAEVSDNRRVIIIKEQSQLLETELQETINGRVTDAQTGEALPGVNVVVEGSAEATGSTIGTTTNMNGYYELQVPEELNTLVFTYIGYQTQEIPIDGRSEIDVELVSEAILGDELVVIGYGAQERRDLTGSVGSIRADDFNPGVTTSVEQLIQGRVAGVQINQTTGEPGGGMSIQIRGVGSINAGTLPLYVIDGVPIDNSDMLGGTGAASTGDHENPRNPLNTLNTNDIESIEILKDASSTAIYGSRAANGVVMITTKRGSAGAVQLDFNSRFGVQSVSNKIDVLSAPEYMQVMNDLSVGRGDGVIFSDSDIQSIGQGTNWQNEVFRRAITTDNNLSIAGGTESATYYISANQYSQEGVVRGSGINGYSLRTNLDTNISDRFQAGFNVTASLVDNENVPEGVSLNETAGVLYTSVLYDPTLPIYNEDGSYHRSPNLTINNPMSLVNGVMAENRIQRFLGNTYLRFNLFDQLQMRANFGFDSQNDKRQIYNSTATIHGQATRGMANIATLNRTNLLFEYIAEFSHDINENNFINVLSGVTYQDFNSETFSGSAEGFESDAIRTYNLGLGDPNNLSVSSNREGNRLLSYLGRINYRLLDRYLLTASIRADGSSRFGVENRFGYFPSLAMAWNLDQEDFIPSGFNELKLRASWGITGNQEIGNNNTRLSFVSGGTAVFDGTRFTGLQPSRIANPELKWEKTVQYNIGLDASILNDRFTTSIDYFIKETNDMLIQQPLPPSSGYSSRLVNLEDATVRNQGIELTLNTINISTQDFSWSTTYSFSMIRNEVTNLGGASRILTGGMQDVGRTILIDEGYPIGAYYGYRITGVMQEGDNVSAQPTAEPGFPVIEDVNGDGMITDADKMVLGDPYPDFILGLQSRLTYRNFRLEFFLETHHGFELLNANMIEAMYPHNFRRNRFREPALNRWTPENTDTKWPSGTNPSAYDGGKVNSLTVVDGTFLRLRNITLTYNIPQNLIRNATASITSQNLFTITNDYLGFNPEGNAYGRSIHRVDYNTTPLPRTILFGLNLGF